EHRAKIRIMRAKAAAFGSARAQRLYLQLRRQFVELDKERRRNRDAVAGPLVAAGGAAVARQADCIDDRQPPRMAQIADVTIDFGSESLQRHKPRDVDCGDEVSGIGLALVIGIEIDDVAAKG